MDALANAPDPQTQESDRVGDESRASRHAVDVVQWCRWMSLSLGGDVPVGLYSCKKNELTLHHFHAANSGLQVLPKAPLLLASVRAKSLIKPIEMGEKPSELLVVPVSDSKGRDWIVGCVIPAANVVIRRAAQRLVRLGAIWISAQNSRSSSPAGALCQQIDQAASEQHAAQLVVDVFAQLMPGWRLSYFASVGRSKLALRAVDGAQLPALRTPWQRSLERVAREFRAQQQRTTGVMIYTLGEQDSSFTHREHARHLENHGGKCLASFGLTALAGEQAAVLVAESDSHQVTSAIDFRQIMSILREIAPTLAWHNQRSQSVWSALSRRAKLSRLLPAIRSAKFKVLVVIAAIGLLLFANTYHVPRIVTAPAELVGQSRQVISAPRNGIIESIAVKAGDTVDSGTVLAVLNTDDLKIQREKWLAQIAKVDAEYHASLAEGDRNLTNLHRAQRAEIEAELAFTDAEIERSVLLSSRNAVVSSSELSQRLGTSVEQGEPLFETASLDNFSVEIRVPDTDIDLVQGGLKGELVLAAKPESVFALNVERIAPKATVHSESNVFMVDANVDQLPSDVMPGMTGYARLHSGTVTLLSAWTRRIRDVIWLLAWRLGLM